MEEILPKITKLENRLELLKKKLDIEGKKAEAKVLEKEMARPGFWDDPLEARRKSRLLALYQSQISEVETFGDKLSLAKEMAYSEEAGVILEDLLKEIGDLEKAIAKLEINTYLSGPYDQRSAILSVHAGQGGIEAMDWAQMLKRMYLRFAESRGWKVDVVDEVAGDEAGVKSVTMTVDGPFAFGYLKKERGVHRLVRQSPFNADRLRQTSFALVEVLPELEEVEEVKIPESDLQWEFFRASSHGGQNVQKVSTAVRLRHLPTGLVVSSQSERYQERNREIALSLLRAKLWQMNEERRFKEKETLKGEHKIAGWGNQIRSYVLHPYKMVKDLRTGYEVNDPFSVLDGELDGFVEAELKQLPLD